MTCPKCGNQLPDTARFCNKCGTPVEGTEAVKEKPIVKKDSRKIFLIVSILLVVVVVIGTILIIRNKCIKKEYDDFGSLLSKTEYNLRGDMTKRIFYNSDGSIEYWVEREYDSHDNAIKNIIHNADGGIMEEYEYDSQGNCVKKITYNTDGSIEFWGNMSVTVKAIV